MCPSDGISKAPIVIIGQFQVTGNAEAYSLEGRSSNSVDFSTIPGPALGSSATLVVFDAQLHSNKMHITIMRIFSIFFIENIHYWLFHAVV